MPEHSDNVNDLIELSSFRILNDHIIVPRAIAVVFEFCQDHSSSNFNLTFLVLANFTATVDFIEAVMWSKYCSALRKSQSYMWSK